MHTKKTEPLYTASNRYALDYKWAVIEAKKPGLALIITKTLDEAVEKWRGYRYTKKFNIIVAIRPENREV